MIIGVCQHGISIAGLDDDLADEDTKRDFAEAYRLERRDFLEYEGQCIPCKERYVSNCELLGIEP